LRLECRILIVAVLFGRASANAQIGWSPPGALIVTRMREPSRCAWPW
jgi:hypothetical protein